MLLKACLEGCWAAAFFCDKSVLEGGGVHFQRSNRLGCRICPVGRFTVGQVHCAWKICLKDAKGTASTTVVWNEHDCVEVWRCLGECISRRMLGCNRKEATRGSQTALLFNAADCKVPWREDVSVGHHPHWHLEESGLGIMRN
jgi:hypothetical protein